MSWCSRSNRLLILHRAKLIAHSGFGSVRGTHSRTRCLTPAETASAETLKELKTLNETQDYERSLAVAGRLIENKNELTSLLTHEVLKTLGATRTYPEYPSVAIKLVQDLIDNGKQVPAQLFKSLATVMMHTTDQKLRQRLVDQFFSVQFGRRSMEVFSRVLLVLIQGNELDAAVKLFRKTLVGGSTVSPHCYEILIHQLLERNDITTAFELILTMNDNTKMTIYTRLWGHFLAKAAELQNYEMLRWLLDNCIIPGYVLPSDSVYYTLVEEGLRHNDKEMTLHAVKNLCHRGFDHDLSLITATAEIYAAHGETVKGIKVLLQIGEQANNIKLRDLPTVTAKLGADVKLVQDVADYLLRVVRAKRQHPNAITLATNLVLAGLIGAGNGQLAAEMMQEFKEHDILPDQETYQLLVRRAVQEGNPFAVEDAYYELVPTYMTPSTAISETLLLALMELGDVHRAREWQARFQGTAARPRAYVEALLSRAV